MSEAGSGREGTLRQRLKSVGGSVFLVVLFLICFWPGWMLELAPAVLAAVGQGTPGVIRLDESTHSKTAGWYGEFRSGDGRIVRERVYFAPEGRHYRKGDTVPARYQSGYVYPRSFNWRWAYPLLVTAAWTGVLIAGSLRLRRQLLQRGLVRERLTPASPAPECTCDLPVH